METQNTERINPYESPMADCKVERKQKILSELEENLIAIESGVFGSIALNLYITPELINLARQYMGW